MQDKFAIESIENISGSISDGWVITLRVRNMTPYAPTLRSGSGDIYCDGALTAKASLKSSVTLPKKGVASVDIPLDIKLHNPLRAIALFLKLNDHNFNGIEVAFNAEFEVMGTKKSISSERVAATKLFEKLGYTTK